MSAHTIHPTGSARRPRRAAATVVLLTTGALAVGGSPAAVGAGQGPEPAHDADPGVVLAHRHQQMSAHRLDGAQPGPAAARVAPTGAAPAGSTFALFAKPGEYAAVDTGDAGDTLGDLVAFTDIISDRAGREVGHAATSCIRTSTELGESQCTATISLDATGSIALQGIVTDADEPLSIAVVGGTGAFHNAGGTMTVTADPSTPDGLRLAFRLVR